MTTLLIAFLFAWGLCLLLTPIARRLGQKCGAVDEPNARKVHACPVPRTGGVAIIAAHILGLLTIKLIGTDISALLTPEAALLSLWAGAALVFGIGLLDDCRGLAAKPKLAVQILAATCAFIGGVAIDPSPLFGWLPILDSWLGSYLLTLFWFVLLINAMNLIDGLDGLAGGIALFVCLVLSVIQVINRDFLLALYFLSLAGSVAGFLRYNFNPATVFMGDSGSYYLGYMIAGLGILGSVKSQVGVTLTLPLLAMGVPVFDTLFAPVRRIILGRRPFEPDRHHLHHKLLAMGLSSKRVVLVLYAVTAALCATALVLVNLQDEQSGLLLVLLGVGVIIALNGLGYFRYVDREKVGSWFRDVSFVTGLHRDRRRFLDLQVRINQSQSLDALWETITHGLTLLDIDYGEIRLAPNSEATDVHRKWVRSPKGIDLGAQGLLKMELPLQCQEGRYLGELWLVKDIKRSDLGHYTLSRIEHLRRAVVRTLSRWDKPST